jgi:hypothetical protein
VDWYESVQWFARFAVQYGYDEEDPIAFCVRHEDVVVDQRATMERFEGHLGMTYPPDFYKFWEFEHHMAAGNSSAYGMIRWHQLGREWSDTKREFYKEEFERLIREPLKPIYDEGWKRDLTRYELFLFDHFCGEINERRGYERTAFSPAETEQFMKDTARAADEKGLGLEGGRNQVKSQ